MDNKVAHHRIILIGIILCHTLCYGQSTSIEPIDNVPLTYASPNEVGMDSIYLYTQVDSIMHHAIKNKAFPGAQLLVAQQGKIIFHAPYGYHTYDSVQKVGVNDLYDLASVTKIMAPLPVLMKLVDEGKLDLDAPFSDYWPSWKRRKEKKDLTLREILAHQAGLEPYIVFLKEVTGKKGNLKTRWIRTSPSSRFPLQAYDHLFVNKGFIKRMYRKIDRSQVATERKYKYSGLSFLLFPKLIADMTHSDYKRYLETHFFHPLGALTMGFTPKTKNIANTIVPTERDTFFRKSLTRSWVHDENAALMGGVSGNAGLFATAKDLAKIMQMYVQYGTYGGVSYLSENTVREFTKVQFPENENRRGLGFDKPLLNNSELSVTEAYPAPEASPESFGHAGFTGTFVWADPKNQLVFIFLSNRVYPTRDHRNLYDLHVRTALHQVFYKAQLTGSGRL